MRTGQLTLPIATRVRAIAGVDPEPDMLVRARRAAAEQGIANVSWLLGADTDIPALAALLGDRHVGVVTIGQALHSMHYGELFPKLVSLLRPGGGAAVITNGTPLRLQDSTWSRALHGLLEKWLGKKLTRTCGTDEASQRRYRDTLTAAGFDVTETRIEYTDELDLQQLTGCLYSALPGPPAAPAGSATAVRRAGSPRPGTACATHRARPRDDAARAGRTGAAGTMTQRQPRLSGRPPPMQDL